MININNENPIYIKSKMLLDNIVCEKETLLLTDDEKAMLELCKEFLEQQKYTVLAAADPDAAIHIAKSYRGKIHMLITDIMMPVMNGLKLAKTLTNIRPDMQCIYISGCLPETIFSPEMLKENINFIQKPFRLKDFAEKIRNALDRHIPDT
ncbi:MAG: response regulator [Proteobacteria bacterium]|nr:response regulator [Pseudomonadota bacterium]